MVALIPVTGSPSAGDLLTGPLKKHRPVQACRDSGRCRRIARDATRRTHRRNNSVAWHNYSRRCHVSFLPRTRDASV